MDFLESLKKRAKADPKVIVLPESGDERILRASEILLKDKLAKVILLGSRPKIEKRAFLDGGVEHKTENIGNPKRPSFVHSILAGRGDFGHHYIQACICL